MFEKLKSKYEENKDFIDIVTCAVGIVVVTGLTCYTLGELNGVQKGIRILADACKVEAKMMA